MARERKKLPAGMYVRGQTYYGRLKGNVRKRLSTDFSAACVLLNELKARADRGDYGLRDDHCKLAELAKKFIEWKKRTSRVGNEYERDVRVFLAICPAKTVAQISHEAVTVYRDERLKAGVSPRTVNKELGVIRHMINKAVAWGDCATNPLAGVEPLPHDTPTKRRRALSMEELEALFAASPERLRIVWRTFAATGLRRDELIELKFSDVDEQRRSLTVRAEISKSHRRREIPLDDETFTTIMRLRDEATLRKPAKGWTAKLTAQQAANFSRDHVFVTAACTPWRNNLLRAFYTCAQRAGITDAKSGGSVDLHALRVSFCSLALEAGANPKAIQTILGHSSLDLTMNTYGRVSDRSKRDAISALPFTTVSTPDHVVTVPARHRSSTSKDRSPQTAATSAIA